MNLPKQMYSKEYLLLGGSLLVCLSILLLGFLLLIPPGSKEEPEAPTPTPFDGKSLPQITPQAFKVGDDKYSSDLSTYDTGSLVVTTNIEGTWAFIDASTSDEHAEAPSDASATSSYKQVPPQYPPFTIEKIPVGKHRIQVAKPDYTAEDLTFEIKKGEVTNLHVTLKKNSGE